MRRVIGKALFGAGICALASLLFLLRFAWVAGHPEDRLAKDPERHPPEGRVIVAPADGTVIYAREVVDGTIPEVVKRGVGVPLVDHLKTDGATRFPDGYLIGIYMSWNGVHVNRVPISGAVTREAIFNGPHMDMSALERRIVFANLVPGWVRMKELLGLPPYDLEGAADFVLKSARETLVIHDVRNTDVYVVRIADYAVGKILTWVRTGERVETGQRLGMIAGGSQTDVFFEKTPGLGLRVRTGDEVYGAESVLATY